MSNSKKNAVPARRTGGMSFDFGDILSAVHQEMALESKWVKTTPRVLFKTPSLSGRKSETRIVLRWLGDLRVWDLDGRKHIDGGAGGWQWKHVDVRVADEKLLAEIAMIDEAETELRQRRDRLYRERFLELEPLTWDDVKGARALYSKFVSIKAKFEKGEASIEEVRAALDALFQKPEVNE